jgi:hypothetical protein
MELLLAGRYVDREATNGVAERIEAHHTELSALLTSE